jgi:hypothetical protein
MSPEEWLLLGFALASVPAVDAGRLAVAALGKRLGVSPGEVRRYSDAAEGDDDGDADGGGS